MGRGMKQLRWIAFGCAIVSGATPASAEELDVKPEPTVREAVENQKGGSPELYRQTREQLDEYERANEYDPKVRKKRKTVALPYDDLEVPFEIEVSRGYLSTITFLDAKGRPFPVRVSRVGDSTTFIVCTGTSADCSISEEDLDIAHILTVGTARRAGRSNLKVLFKGLHQAVQIPLVGKKSSYHDEVTIMLPIDNPDASSPVAASNNLGSIRETDDMYARALIDGIAVDKLPDAIALEVSIESMAGRDLPNSGNAAMFANGNTYLKTRIIMPEPTPTGVTAGFASSKVYRFEGKQRAITGFDENGSVVIIKLTPPENVLGYRELRVR